MKGTIYLILFMLMVGMLTAQLLTTTVEEKCYVEYTKVQVPIYATIEECSDIITVVDCKDKDAIINTSSHIESCYKYVESCWNTQILKGYLTTVVNETMCKDAIIYKDDVLEYERHNINCVETKEGIICDDDSTGDGNGDGICQSGETCHRYKLTDKIELVSIYNGDEKIR